MKNKNINKQNKRRTQQEKKIELEKGNKSLICRLNIEVEIRQRFRNLSRAY